MKEFYNRTVYGLYYDPLAPRKVPERYNFIIEEIRTLLKKKHPRVLEIGSENPSIPAYWSTQLNAPASECMLVDINSHSKKVLQEAGFNVEVLDICTDKVPCDAGIFDVVILSEVLEHLLDVDSALSEIRRIISQNGIMVVTTPNLASWANRIQLLLGFQPLYTETGREWVFGRGPLIRPNRPVGHLQVYTLPGLEGLLTYHSWNIKKKRGLPWSAELEPSPHLRRIDRFFSSIPSLASGLLLIATPNASTEGPSDH